MIELKNITKSFANGAVRTDVLKGITFRVDDGEFVAIMAPSGTGKTTLLSILGCLMQATDGDYFLDGVNIRTLDDDHLSEIRNKKVGFIFQTFNLLDRTSALDNVLLPVIYSPSYPSDAKKKAVHLLESVGLGDRLNYKPSELSGGQQQRVAIARSLINDPSLILADEPTGNLDAKSSDEVMEIFNRLHQQRKTILIVTHNLEVARMADRIVFLKDGRVDREEATR